MSTTLDLRGPDQGWECPRCGKINAPWRPSCDCHGQVRDFASGNDAWKEALLSTSDKEDED